MTISAITFDTKQASQYAKHFRKAPEIVSRETRVSMFKVLSLLEREIKEVTPKGVGGAAGLRGSVTHELRGTVQDGVRGKVFSPLKHAAPVEYGTKPHLPPFTALFDWVEKILGITDPDEIVGVAVRIALKIQHHGTKGAHMFEKTFNRYSRQINDEFDSIIDRVILRLENG